MQSSALLVLVAFLSATSDTTSVRAFTAGPARTSTSTQRRSSPASATRTIALWATTEQSKSDNDSSFVPLESAADDDETFRKVEMFGRGAAKVKRGKRKGPDAASASTAVVPEKSALAAEDVYYEGPPAITETIAPTISILTVVGIIPAMAAWARQAWVRYRITNRRIRVTSGIGGQDMAEIVYADIVELRTAKRLFGDGDLVAFLRDGAKFEMRNIPNFDETIEFILKQVSPDVATAYRTKGEVTKRQ